MVEQEKLKLNLRKIRQNYKGLYAFIAFPSANKFKVIVQSVVKVCREKDITPYFVEYGVGDGNVVDDINQGIVDAKWIIADETPDFSEEIERLSKKNKNRVLRSNPNVMYEIGYAKGLGKHIISCVQEEYLENLCFDTKTNRKIIYSNKNLEKLENELRRWLDDKYYSVSGTSESSSEEKKSHDIQIFERLDSIFSEDALIELFDNLNTDMITSKDLKNIDDLCTFCEKIGNSFIDSSLEEKKLDFSEKIFSLSRYTGSNFFPTHKKGLYKLHPGDFIGYKEKAEIRDIMHEKLNATVDSYKNFRESIKIKLYV